MNAKPGKSKSGSLNVSSTKKKVM